MFISFGRVARCVVAGVGLLAATFARAAEAIESQPLAARSGPRGATMFATLPAEQTGVVAINAYNDPTMWWEHYNEYSLGAIGNGLAIGDYDNDGRPDLFAVCKTGPNRLFRNLGGWRFEDVTDKAGGLGGSIASGVWNNGAAFADVNNDGWLDLYVCRTRGANLLYINQRDGTFREEAAARGLALNDASGMAAFCDYDRDGWLDVYVQTNLLDGERRPNGQPDHLYHNNGNGTFTDVSERAGIGGDTQGHAATWWDFDEDGWPDIYIDNDFIDPDVLYHNQHDGTFRNVLSLVVPHTPNSSMGADLADVNNDGHLDLLVLDMDPTTRYKDHRGMAKLRAQLLDDEQRPEAAVQIMRNALYLNTGAGVMLEAAQLAGLASTDWTWSVRFEDYDNDGWVDVHFTNGIMRELHGIDILQQMATKERIADRIKIMKSSPVLNENNLAFRNRGELRFENVSQSWGLDHLGVSFGAATGDLDGDGDLDLAFVNMDGNVTLCRNDTDSGHAVTLALRGTTSNRYGVGAIVRIETDAGEQARSLTLARGYDSTSEPIVHFGLGEQTQIKRLTIEWPSGRHQAFTDLVADRRYTITESAEAPVAPPPTLPTPQFVPATDAARLNVPNRDTPWSQVKEQPLISFRLNRPGPPALFANLDSDREDDLVLGGVTGEPGQFFSNMGGGQFLGYGRSDFSELAAVADGPMVALDVDADGDLDLLLTKAGIAAPADDPVYRPRLLLNDGSGRFSGAPADIVAAPPMSVGAAAAADFEHSGRLGVFLGGRVVPGSYAKPAPSVLLASRDGRLVDVTAEAAPMLANRGMVTGALWSDVDADGWIDLLVAYDWGHVACYRNIEGKTFEDATERLGFAAAGTGWWRSLSAADFNGDGRPDYVAGNVGLNTPFRASSAEPALLYVGVSVDGSAPQLIEAHAENGVWYPRRTRLEMLKLFPSLAKRFRDAESYARAPLEDVFPAASLAAATKFAVTKLQSGVFLSQLDGTFRFAPLPRLAQIAPVFGTAAGDFDGDGRADILLVGNSYAAVPFLGRMDGGVGWLLRGDGRGGFMPISAGESGVIVRRDAKSLLVADLNQDGWPDFFATRNNDRPLAYLNRALPGRRSFGVALQAARGNPAAIGARLTLTLADGSHQTAEIAAGSGYFAQSSATVFFGYLDSALPTELKIRWPDGRESVQTFSTPPAKIIRFSAP
ncbi:FG-GAP-like repeat-containing protein [Opitutus terrae]|uniref:ASPIC/UnbV domain protein n=1 Tax=Opitutus terrae (strain DSM 11246 / JCM 15787 / PB90-1) TaxID=452637 RepID=B1ZRW6_OPITP|nr:FG-GAP-like repeat-containing protein [Opitutus terrae]ACB73808.1 ASPIC/UnbV domain protein [Opitutus terrae PB90-1]